MKSNYYAVIMAGGVGSRFWPVSTQAYPKQFHDMLGTGKTLLQTTFERINTFIPKENILILTNEQYSGLVLSQLPAITAEQVLLEPVMRNTAPCILYAALKIYQKNPDAVMLVAPSDHWIENTEAFTADCTLAFTACAEQEILMTLGIKPTFPNTGYGYIEFNNTTTEQIKKVNQFREKPDYATAKEFLAKGNFLWNAGIFIWGVHTIIKAFKEHQPEMYSLFSSGTTSYNTEREQEFISKNYHKAQNISIDYAILEKANAIYVLPATFDWNDLGTWGSLYNKLEKDSNQNAVVNAKVFCENASGNMIRTTTKNKLVVVNGLQDYIVVDKDNVLLIHPKSKEQEIKEVLNKVKQQLGEQYG